MDPLVFLSVSLVLAAATATDLRSQRIPNALTLPAAVLALAYHALTGGVGGFWFGLCGLGLGLVLMLAPFLFNVMGGGDVKLMATVGAWTGPELLLSAFVFTSLAGGGYALFVLARRVLLRSVWTRFSTALYATAATGRFDYAPATAGTAGLPRLCYGLAIALGTLAAMIVTVLGAGWQGPAL